MIENIDGFLRRSPLEPIEGRSHLLRSRTLYDLQNKIKTKARPLSSSPRSTAASA